MSVTVASLYAQICQDILEPLPTGLSKGLVSEQQALDLIGQIVMDFMKQTGLVQVIFTQYAEAGVSRYLVPDSMPEVYYCLMNARIVEKDDVLSDFMKGQWQRKNGPAKMWHEDGLPIKTVEIVPAPVFNGTPPDPSPPQPPYGSFGSFQAGSRNLTFVGSWIGAQEVYGMGDTLSAIPDSFTPYIVFGVLERIFSMDGEAKDAQRAQYAHSRYSEGISLGRTILMDLMEDERKYNDA